MLLSHCLSVLIMMQTPSDTDALLTIAESSDYSATATSAQVMDLIGRIGRRSAIMRTVELGKTSEGKPIPLIILANPPIDTPEQARAASVTTGKPICFVMANIHAGEIEGKESTLALIREIALNPDHALLKDLIIIFAPNYNADGNDKMSMDSRPGQVGPAMGQGQRPNAMGLDLNRDYIKLEAPESLALVHFLTQCDPHLTIDCHTTNGSAHRYVLTYEAPLNPSGHHGPIDFVRNQLLPTVTKRIKDHSGYDMWFYGNFENNHTVWATYSAQPRFGGPYLGLRNQMSILSEAYSYAPYKDRVLATTEFIRETLQYVAENKAAVMQINDQARRETAEKGRNPQPDDTVGIRHRIAAFNELTLVKGFENAKGGEGGAPIDPHVDHGPPKDYAVVHQGRFEPTLSVRRPFAYIIPIGLDAIVDKIRQHGIEIEPFAGAATVEVYTITKIDRAADAFQGHQTVLVEAKAALARQSFPQGSFLVRTGQPLGTLAVYLLEPQSEDGFVTWNFLDRLLALGKEFPIVRVRAAQDLQP